MALELLLLRHALVSLLVLLVVVHAPGATRARDLHLEMVTSTVASCASWRLGVETNNIRDWYSIPAECRSYVRDYMYGDLFRQDCAVVAGEAAAYAEGLELGGDGKEVWVFDVDDTTLSNLPYYADTGFGAEPYNATYFDEYVANATAPPLPEVLELYEKLLSLGIKVVFITGRHDTEKEATIENLRSAGYHTWEKLVLKPPVVARRRLSVAAAAFFPAVPAVALPPPRSTVELRMAMGGAEGTSRRRRRERERGESGGLQTTTMRARDPIVVESDRREVQRCWNRLLRLGARASPVVS